MRQPKQPPHGICSFEQGAPLASVKTKERLPLGLGCLDFQAVTGWKQGILTSHYRRIPPRIGAPETFFLCVFDAVFENNRLLDFPDILCRFMMVPLQEDD
jgi:hypothetical protein